MAFKMRSGNSTSFKKMGSSPYLDKDPHTKTDPPHEHDKVSTIQKVQTALTGAELIPDVHPVAAAISSTAGVANTVLSAGQAGYHYLKGETEEGNSDLIDATLSGVGSVPGAGYGATVAKGLLKTGQLRHLDDGLDIVAEGIGYDTRNEEGKGGFGNMLSPEVEGGGIGKDSDAYASVAKIGGDLKNWWYGE